MENPVFYKCGVCGNMVGLIKNGGGTLVCCGQPMTLLKANTTDGAKEKHVPFAQKSGSILKVVVGEVEHPMTPEHHIEWICIMQGSKVQRVSLEPGAKPEASFTIEPDGKIDVYEYCNLHGLWMATVE